MGTTAVGAYLRTLRETQQISRAALAAQVGTHESQLVRIEAGDQDTRGSFLLRLISRLKGTADDIAALIEKNATEEEGKSLAQQRLAGRHSRLNPQRIAALERLDDEQLDRLIALAESISPPK